MTDPLEGTVDDKGIYLVIANEKFVCRRVSVSWQMMQFANAQRKAHRNPVPEHLPKDNPDRIEAERIRNEAGIESMAAMRAIIMKVIKPSERQRFEEFMDEVDIDPGALEEAIGDVIAAIGGQDDNKGKAQESHSRSLESHGITNGSAVVNLSNQDMEELQRLRAERASSTQ